MRAVLTHISFAAVVAALALTSQVAEAGNFQVEPTRIDLARRGAATELTLTNRGQSGARFEAKVFVWGQDEQGVMQLAPTKDLVVYPTLFSLEPGTKRAIRIASAGPPTGVERSYRIMIEELPAPRVAAEAGAPASIAVRTRIGVPIFVAPTTTQIRGEVRGSASAGTLMISLGNLSTVHVKVATVRVVATDHEGKVVLDRNQASWYVLAKDTRVHTLALDAGTCTSIARIAIEAATDRGTWKTTIAMPADGCRESQ